MSQCFLEKARSRRLLALRHLRRNRAAQALVQSVEILDAELSNIFAIQDGPISKSNVVYHFFHSPKVEARAS